MEVFLLVAISLLSVIVFALWLRSEHLERTAKEASARLRSEVSKQVMLRLEQERRFRHDHEVTTKVRELTERKNGNSEVPISQLREFLRHDEEHAQNPGDDPTSRLGHWLGQSPQRRAN